MAPPNILLLIADDHRHDALSCAGHPVVRTPNLDALTARGTRCSHVFTTVPICTPARAELLTGVNALAAGVPWFGHAIRETLPTMPRHFAQNGYRTFAVGKWHNDGAPGERGFQTVRRRFGGMGSHTMTFEENGKSVTGQSSELFADAAIECIGGRGENGSPVANVDAPFFGWVAFTAPHDPRTPTPTFAAMYEAERMDLPENYLPEHPFDNGALTIRDELLDNFPRTHKTIQKHRADYYGMITELDWHIGRILKTVPDNTLVVYTGDHGLAIGSHGLMGKENLYDHSTRIPLIFAGPGVSHSTVCNGLATSFDLFPTLCDLACVPQAWEQGERLTHVEGRSLVQMLGDNTPVRAEVYGSFMEHQRSVRDNRYKLIWYPQILRAQLFDLQSDPHEACDRMLSWRYTGFERKNTKSPAPFSDKEEMWAIAARLAAHLIILQREHGDDDALICPAEPPMTT